MNLDRLGGSTFDFTVKTNRKKHYDVESGESRDV